MPNYPKPKTFRSKPYLAFVRKHKCLVCHSLAGIVAHHEGLGLNMQGGKPPDSHCVPLCLQCHIFRHSLEWEGWDKECVDIKMVIIKLLTEYLQEGENEATIYLHRYRHKNR